MLFFFFSSRRRHTRLQGDWSSDVCSSDLVLAQEHVVVSEEDGMGTRPCLADEMRPLADESLPGLVRRMRLAGDDELYRALGIAQKAKETWRVMEQQVRSLVGGEAARKAERECVGIEEMPGGFDILGRRASGGEVQGQTLASILYQRLAGGRAKLP